MKRAAWIGAAGLVTGLVLGVMVAPVLQLAVRMVHVQQIEQLLEGARA